MDVRLQQLVSESQVVIAIFGSPALDRFELCNGLVSDDAIDRITLSRANRRHDVELNFSLTLPDELYRELIDGCRERSCSPKQFAAESLEILLASRRLPRVAAAPYGARMTVRETEDVEPEGYPVHCP